jgi:hypothetical protein
MASIRPDDLHSPRKSIFTFPRPNDRDARCRGSLFGPVRLFVTSYLGPDRWEELLTNLEPGARTIWQTEFDALSWYPFWAISAALDALVVLPDIPPDTIRKLAYHNLDRATNLIFRAIFKVGSPEFMVSKSDQVWNKYYSTGTMRVAHASKGSAVIQLFDFPEITHNYNRVILHGIEAVIVKAGGRIKREEIARSIHLGDECCEYTFAWF